MANMQIVYTNQGTVGTYAFADNPTQYTQTEKVFAQRDRATDTSLKDFFRGIKNMFALDFEYIGTAQYANLGTIFRTQDRLTFYPRDEVRGTTGSYAVRWINDFEFGMIGPAWDSGFKGRILLEEL